MFGQVKQHKCNHQGEDIMKAQRNTTNRINTMNNLFEQMPHKRAALLVIPVLLALWLGMVGTSYAECVQDGTECKDVYIQKLLFSSHGGIYIGTTGNEVNLHCDHHTVLGDTASILLKDEHPNKKEIYSMLLSAKIIEKTVSIYTYKDGACAVYYVIFE